MLPETRRALLHRVAGPAAAAGNRQDGTAGLALRLAGNQATSRRRGLHRIMRVRFHGRPRARRGWVGRGLLAGVLLATIFLPGQASGEPVAGCRAARCGNAGAVRWAEPLPGTWTAVSAMTGTVPAPGSGGQAYAAADRAVAAIGVGLTVYAFAGRTGQPLWQTTITGFPAGAAIVSLRVW